MKIIIQCAGSKHADAGCLKDQAGNHISFVAHPDSAAAIGSHNRARPDDPVDPSGTTWRQRLVNYNAAFRESGKNPLALLPAGALYKPQAYTELRRCVDPTDAFILSAGWGLVRADFLLPDYDITFSKQSIVAKESRRSIDDEGWRDFNQLSDANLYGENLHFFGGSEYLKLFYRLIDSLDIPQTGEIVIHYKVVPVRRTGYRYEKFIGNASTNWHYIALRSHLQSLSD